MDFRKYMHVERFGNTEVEGIELGECYVFPKLDGTNASAWLDGSLLKGGSRNRELTLDNDNAGFYNWLLEATWKDFWCEYPHLRLYAEWLVPHSLRTYRDDAWRKFYVFDVFDETEQKYIHYNAYKPLLDSHNIDYIPPLCVMRNATYESLLKEVENNRFLIKDGAGSGEGVVIKNYDFVNKYGRTVWAKIVTNEFKEKNVKTMGATVKNMKEMAETVVANDYVTPHLVDKVHAKIATEMDGWSSKYIPRLLQTVFYDLVNEEMWNVVKKLKQPTINFKTLYHLTVLRVKELKPELF